MARMQIFFHMFKFSRQKTNVSNDCCVQSTAITLTSDNDLLYIHGCCFSQEEIESQKQHHEARIIAIKAEEKQKMDKITKELDHKWTDALRYCNQDPHCRNVSEIIYYMAKGLWTITAICETCPNCCPKNVGITQCLGGGG